MEATRANAQNPEPLHQILIDYNQMVRLAPKAWERDRALDFSQRAIAAAVEYRGRGPNPDRVLPDLFALWEARGWMLKQLADMAADPAVAVRDRQDACVSFQHSLEEWNGLHISPVRFNYYKRYADAARESLDQCPPDR